MRGITLTTEYMNEMSNEGKDAGYVLLQREIRPPQSWKEFLECWENTKDSFTMEGLLHKGYDELYIGGEEAHEKRLRFYFNVAHGWNDRNALRHPDFARNCYDFRNEDGSIIERSEQFFRQKLARKAFDILCLKFFKLNKEFQTSYSRKDERMRWWQDNILTTHIFMILVNFFFLDDDMWIMNLINRKEEDRSHNEGHVLDFFLYFTNFLFEWKEYPIYDYESDHTKEEKRKYNEKMKPLILVGRIWIIEVLNQLNKLNVLEKWILEFDECCIEKFKEISMRTELDKNEHPVKANRKVETIEEAYFAGSVAAHLLVRNKISKGEYDRLRGIQVLEWEAEEAQKKLEEAKRGRS